MADELISGGIPYAVGQASILRIPIPGTDSLAIELKPRGSIPPSGSTSSLFFQDLKGKRQLRLDYGRNSSTNTVDFHWNQKGTFKEFGIADHTTVGTAGKVAYKAAKYFKFAGRMFVVAGVTLDVVSVVKSSQPLRRATQVVSGWALAWVGCKAGGYLGAEGGSAVSPGVGTAAGGIGGCIIGGGLGYFAGGKVGDRVYSWGEGTVFSKVPEAANP